ncbi:MAG: phosphoserine phosphatase SerB [archaeon]
MSEKDWVVINISGKDRVGIIADISKVFAENNLNIIDIGHTVIHKMFSMFMIVDLSLGRISCSELQEKLYAMRDELSLNIELSKLENEPLAKCTNCVMKKKYVLSVVARNRTGLVYEIANYLSLEKVNILKISLVARDNLITIEMLLDIGTKSAKELRCVLREKGASLGMDIVFQREDIFSREKRLIVFDMDSTIVDAEIIDEIAKKANVESRVKALTQRAMNGEMDFKESLRLRVKLLMGLDESVLKDVYDNLRLTPGAEELIRALKLQGYKTALVSGGFTYFTDKLNERLNFDHVYANKLVIEDNRLTGEIEGDIIDALKKWEIIEELRMKYGLQKDQVVAVGDGANDSLMLENAGLGIAFNAKEALKKVASGSISKENFVGLLNVLRIRN